MKRPLITLLTDFGSADHYVAAMKGVMLGICPEAQFVDISHEVGAYAVTEAAWMLGQAMPCFPGGTIHLVVVDPGVGGSRRALVAEAGGQRFAGPDNGVLTQVLDAGSKVHEIDDRRFFREPVSATFHGRDIFAPVAAHLAQGRRPEDFGTPVHDWKLIDTLRPQQNADGSIEGVVIKVDRFGNLITNFDSALLATPRNPDWRIEVGPHAINRVCGTFSGAARGEVFAIAGSAGVVELAMNQESAAAELGARSGTPVRMVRK